MYKTREKMPPAHRAKQFMPFAGVKGLQEALREKEKLYTERREPAEDEADKINSILNSVHTGSTVTITYYSGGICRSIQGAISDIDKTQKLLLIADTPIGFSDILSISPP